MRALFFWYTGALKLKMHRKVYNIRKGIGVNCVFPLCPGLNEMSHVNVCMFYQTKWSDRWTSDEELADYLTKINREQLQVYKIPLF